MSVNVQSKIESFLIDQLKTASPNIGHPHPYKIAVDIIAQYKSLSYCDVCTEYLCLLFSQWIRVRVKVRFVVVGEQPLDVAVVSLQELVISF